MSGRKQLKYVVLLDCGDTIVDEATEEKDFRGATLAAELIPGAKEMVHGLVDRGYSIGLVADGFEDTFKNALRQHGLYHLFAVMAISELVGVTKPDAAMFLSALDEMGVPKERYTHVVMVGNNLERDIKGANQLGLTSIFLSWSPRRSKTPADESETPDYTIGAPADLLVLMDALESGDELSLEPFRGLV